MTARDLQAHRLVGLDTLRFVAALVVTMSHLGVPPLLAGLERTHPLAFFLSASYGVSCNGPAAVIVFFVISGLCIHYPSIDEVPSWPRYFVRRYVRIVIPLLASIGLSTLVGIPYLGFSATILWSLQCELIYYTIYPLLLLLRRRFGWAPLITASFAVALATVFFVQPRAQMYPVFGWKLNWLVGLPCWLLGCLLAERVRGRKPVRKKNISLYRFAVWLGSAVALALTFHSPIGYPWTLTAFSLLVYVWLREELPHLAATRVPALGEKLGVFSYSLYLVHLPALEIYKKYYKLKLGFLIDWMLLFGLAFAFSYLFFRVFEAPSHKLARFLASAIEPKKSAVAKADSRG